MIILTTPDYITFLAYFSLVRKSSRYIYIAVYIIMCKLFKVVFVGYGLITKQAMHVLLLRYDCVMMGIEINRIYQNNGL